MTDEELRAVLMDLAQTIRNGLPRRGDPYDEALARAANAIEDALASLTAAKPR